MPSKSKHCRETRLQMVYLDRNERNTKREKLEIKRMTIPGSIYLPRQHSPTGDTEGENPDKEGRKKKKTQQQGHTSTLAIARSTGEKRSPQSPRKKLPFQSSPRSECCCLQAQGQVNRYRFHTEHLSYHLCPILQLLQSNPSVKATKTISKFQRSHLCCLKISGKCRTELANSHLLGCSRTA